MRRIRLFVRLVWRQCIYLEGRDRFKVSTAWQVATVLARIAPKGRKIRIYSVDLKHL
jgi:translation initiation factor IF-1